MIRLRSTFDINQTPWKTRYFLLQFIVQMRNFDYSGCSLGEQMGGGNIEQNTLCLNTSVECVHY